MLAFRKRLLTLSVAIGVLAAAYVLGVVFSPANVRRREVEAPLVPRFEAQGIAKIRLTTGQGKITLEKKGEGWFVPIGSEQYPASDTRIEALLDFLRTIRRSRLITSNPEAWSDFGVDQTAANKIETLDATDKVTLEIIVGKEDQAQGGSYVRLGSSNEVVLVNRLFDYYLNTEAQFWSYLRMFPKDLEGTSLNRISVQSAAGFPAVASPALNYTLLLGEERQRNWKVLGSSAGQELDNDKVDRLAGTLASLEGTGFAAGVDAAAAGLTKPAAEILASTADGKDLRLLVGSSAGEERYYATVEGSKYVYEVALFRLQSLFKPLSELRAEPKPAAGAGGQ
jgi:hypothetical protein